MDQEQASTVERLVRGQIEANGGDVEELQVIQKARDSALVVVRLVGDETDRQTVVDLTQI